MGEPRAVINNGRKISTLPLYHPSPINPRPHPSKLEIKEKVREFAVT